MLSTEIAEFLSISHAVRRDLVDAGYAVIIRAMFAQLERTAGPDVKHGDRLRLENYTLLETELQPLAKKVMSPCLIGLLILRN